MSFLWVLHNKLAVCIKCNLLQLPFLSYFNGRIEAARLTIGYIINQFQNIEFRNNEYNL